MAQTNYTPILIYSSSTTTNVPSAANLTNSTLGSELAINITDGKLFYKDNANAVQVIGWKTTPTTAGGTGLTSYTAGDLLYYASGTTLSKLAIGSSGKWLGSSGTAPQWNSPAALTKTDDTNVTLTLGGSASTALLNAASLTLGWTGTLAVSRGGTGTGTASITAFNNITGYTASGATGTTSTNLVFSTSPTLTTLTNIGAGLFYNSEASGGDYVLIRQDYGNSASKYAGLLFQGRDSAGTSHGVKSTGAIRSYGDTADNTNSNLQFFVNNSDTLVEAARFASTKGLLLNTTTIGAGGGGNTILSAVSLSGQDAAFIKCASASAGNLPLGCWNDAGTGDNALLYFYTNATISFKGGIDFNRGAGLVRYNTSSDGTLKNIIGDSDGKRSIEILKTTRLRDYTWKDDPDQNVQMGPIAQELYETYKGAVSVGGNVEKIDDEGNVTVQYRPWAVDKTAYSFHLVAGWQAHEKTIQDQQALIEKLIARVDALEAK